MMGFAKSATHPTGCALNRCREIDRGNSNDADCNSSFTDLERGDEALVMIRVTDETIALAVSRERNGDIEVLFGTQELDHRGVAESSRDGVWGEVRTR
jgi:hypothetical protein